MDGIILTYKKRGETSRKKAEEISKKYNVKAGHIGTLDPLAEGLFPVLVGNSCKLANYMQKHNKSYYVEMIFGYETDTLDLEGEKILEDNNFLKENIVDEKLFEKIIEALKKVRGTYMQIPPIYSAKSINGERLYNIARKDRKKAEELAAKKAKEIHIYNIYDISLKELWENGKDIVLSFFVDCSSGTYIRALVRDIAYNMNTYATMTKLVRTKVGKYSMDLLDEEEIDEFEEKYINEEDILNGEFKEVELYSHRKKPFLNGLDTTIDEKDGIYLVKIDGKIIGLRRSEKL